MNITIVLYQITIKLIDQKIPDDEMTSRDRVKIELHYTDYKIGSNGRKIKYIFSNKFPLSKQQLFKQFPLSEFKNHLKIKHMD